MAASLLKKKDPTPSCMIPHFSSSEKEFSAGCLWRRGPVRSVDPRCTVYVLRAVLSLLQSVRFGQPSVRRNRWAGDLRQSPKVVVGVFHVEGTVAVIPHDLFICEGDDPLAAEMG